MTPTQKKIAALVLGLGAVTGLGFAGWKNRWDLTLMRKLPFQAELSAKRVPGLPKKAVVIVKDLGENPAAHKSRFEFKSKEEWSDNCPLIRTLGDYRLPSNGYYEEKIPKKDDKGEYVKDAKGNAIYIDNPCPNTEGIALTALPVTFTWEVVNGNDFVAFLKSNPSFQEIWNSKLVNGAFADLLQVGRLSGEELGVKGAAAGAFLWPFLEDALKADARVHIDTWHGKRGVTLEFNASKSKTALKALTAAVDYKADRAWDIHGLKNPVWRVGLGGQEFFVFQDKKQVFVSSGLTGLLNAIDARPVTSAAKGTLVAHFRMESVFGVALEQVSGQPQLPVSLGFALNATSAQPAEGGIPSNRIVGQMGAGLDGGLLKSIPSQVFFSMATGLDLPTSFDEDDLKKQLASGKGIFSTPEKAGGGLGFIWDIDPTSGEAQVGIAYSGSQNLRAFFSDKAVRGNCGAVQLAATSQALLAHMTKSCQGQEPSLGVVQPASATSSLVMALNARTMLRAAYGAGGGFKNAGATDGGATMWKPEYEKAMQAAAQSAEKTIEMMPSFGWMGSRSGDALSLKGFVNGGAH